MTKLEVQKRVLKNGKPLDLELYEWDESTRTFSSSEDELVLDFKGINNCTFKTGSDCTFVTGSNCTFVTYSNCTFKTGSVCTFKTGSDCTFNVSRNSVIVRRDEFEVIVLEDENNEIQLCPCNVKGYLKIIDDKQTYSRDENKSNEYIIADNILSRIINKKGNIYKVVNYNETNETYLIEQDESCSHGETLKQAKESLIYKLLEKDLSVYENLSLDTELSLEEGIKMYRSITGACEYGTKSFVDTIEEKKESYTIEEIINLTKGHYGNEQLRKYFEK